MDEALVLESFCKVMALNADKLKNATGWMSKLLF